MSPHGTGSYTELGDLTVFIAMGSAGTGSEPDPDTEHSSDLGAVIGKHLIRQGVQRLGIMGTDESTVDRVTHELFTLASGIWALGAVGDPADSGGIAAMIDELSRGIGDPDVLIKCLPTSSSSESPPVTADDEPIPLTVDILPAGSDGDQRDPGVFRIVADPRARADDIASEVLDVLARTGREGGRENHAQEPPTGSH